MAEADCRELVDGTPLRIALIGLGARGRRHLAVCESCAAVEIVGVSDAEGTVVDFPFRDCEVYSDTGDLLDATQPRAAIISVPHSAYFGAVTECCERGVVMLKEKPLGRSAGEAREILGAVERSNADLVVASQRRHSSVFAAMERVVGEAVPPPYAVHCEYTLGLPDGGSGWRLARDLAGGGAALDMGYHVFDQLTALFGVPNQIAALAGNPREEGPNAVEHLIGGLLSFSTGTLATVLIGRQLSPEREQMRIWGKELHLAMVDDELWQDDRDGPRLVAKREPSNELLHRQLHEFARFVTLGASGSCGAADAMRTTETVEMVQGALATVASAERDWIRRVAA